MSADEQEFMDVAKKPHPKNPRLFSANLLLGNSIQKATAVEDDDEEPKPEPGQKVQYARAGSGFIAATSTVAVLPANLYNVIQTDSGRLFSPVTLTTDRLLRLPDTKSDEVISEIEKFWTLKPAFTAFGYSHKRGFLLWGPPGSGKTSTVAVVMKQMIADGGVVILGDNHPETVSRSLADLREVEPERRVVVVLEDLDTIISTYGESTVLSLLDGERSIDNVVFLATTNYPENLDGRVINRPSRFDRVVKIGMPSADARRVYIESRNLGIGPIEIEAWVELTDGFSIAHIKELIVGVMCFGNDLGAESERLRGMAKRISSSDGEKAAGFSLQ